jgi:hypothetical protein
LPHLWDNGRGFSLEVPARARSRSAIMLSNTPALHYSSLLNS